ncbi:MAG: hypothetical protein KDB80_02670, partial [Planctomycetes bacterium]|nr:hypothetical protein [Planctomycetota bacterium]
DSLRLDREFEPPDLETWHAQVRKDLRGKDYVDLGWNFDDGDPIDPLATRADLEGLPHCGDAPMSWLGTPGAWRARELIVTAEPEACARRARQALDDGADEIEICFDDLCRDALDADADELPGLSGVAIHDLTDLRTALTNVDLRSTHLGLSAGEGAVAALGQLLALADERGVAADELRGDVDFDPIARLTQRQVAFDPDDEDVLISSHTSIQHVFDDAAALIRQCAATCPGIRPLTLDGQGFHLCGADPAVEVAATIALVIDNARQLATRGVSFDEMTRAATLRVQVAHELLTDIAKLRALRLLWLIVGNAFDATRAGLRPEVQGVTSGRSRSYRFDTRTNLLRTTLAATAAILGGCDSIAIVPFDEDPASQDDAMARLARHHHSLLREESHLDRVRDPIAGSFAIERLTDRIARTAWRHVQEIERVGGLCESMRSGHLLELVLPSAESRIRSFATRSRTMVGINRYQDVELEGAPTRPVVDDATLERLRERSASRRRNRDEAACQRALDELVDASTDRLAIMRTAAEAGATTSELARAGWPDGEFHHRFPPIAQLDGDEFEELREAREHSPATAIVATLDDSKDAAAHAAFAASILRLGGYRVETRGPLQSADECHHIVGEIRPHIVVLAGSHDALSDCIDRVVDHGALVGVAGVPEPWLEARGVAAFHDGMDVVATLTRVAGVTE